MLALCLVLALVSDLTFIGRRIDNSAYDIIYTLFPPGNWEPHSAILALDEATYNKYGGQRNLRRMVAESLRLIEPAHPKAVGIDVVLADESDPAEDAQLEEALRATTANIVLSCEYLSNRWELPIARFAKYAKGVGHVHPDENSSDGVNRAIPLELATGGQRYWALSMEAFRVSLPGSPPILEGPREIQVGAYAIPAGRYGERRNLRLSYRTAGIPTVSLADLAEHPEKASVFAGKVVFVGVTALAGRRDQLIAPFGGSYVSGVEIHAQTLETLAEGRFITNTTELVILAVCGAIALAMFGMFAYFAGWPAYGGAAAVLLAAHLVPVAFLRSGVYFPYFASFATAWLSVVAAAGYEYFVVRKQLARSQSERDRYQQAIHFVAHEMRTPLSSIQGQSELMGRFALPEEKRKQMIESINSESKRLARLIQTFLDVERLSDGQMQLKREAFDAATIVEACARRVRPLAERKKIRFHVAEPIEGDLNGDRELMEYAIYNLMTNAVKYSPPETEVWVRSRRDNGHVRMSVEDQGIGMDEQEQKKVFQKFYRTKKAESSGEAGTGIGLSIVDQIVTHHGGRMDLRSAPGKGSCFTIVLPTAGAAQDNR